MTSVQIGDAYDQYIYVKINNNTRGKRIWELTPKFKSDTIKKIYFKYVLSLVTNYFNFYQENELNINV